ncbi:MAG: aminotransferase class I/II-fold pyridoxal phosphate-dependent enzyme [Spirochaetaceae bacterium]|nr:aminotransferase class I/II-fold pyridoxal phosphate-dependent enzyme [Spirochaetaceae bacterium]
MLNPFKLERYFAQHEFSARFLLCTSDCESMTVGELLALDQDKDSNTIELDSTWLGYTESRGNPALRQTIGGLYEGIDADAVLLHSGAEEAILNFCLATIESGDPVIVNTPCYQSLQEIPRSLGASVMPWQLRNNGKRWELDLACLGAMLEKTSKPPLVILNMPHNPTGALMSREEFAELIRLCRLHGATLLMDEVYRYLERDAAERLPAACEAYEKAVSLSVLSKAWGLAGLRIGWLASKDSQLLDKVASVKDYNSICASAPSETLALAAVRQTAVITAKNRQLCAQNTALFRQFFEKHENYFGWIPPVAGSVAFPWIRNCTAQASADRLARELLEDTGILLLPGSHYSFDPAYFRIGLGRAATGEALGLFDAWLDSKRL